MLAGVDLDLPERARFSAATLHGLDTMVFSTEVLPLLSGRDDVRVEVSGRVPDYREAGDSLRIGVSAAELDGEQDWFDLGITITVEGREVPFAELFVALASGQSHLLLPDGAYFSLDKPELMALARLIEEARALTDRLPPGRPAAHQQVPGRPVGRAGRARRGPPSGRGVAAPGAGRCSIARALPEPPAPPGRRSTARAAAPVPALRVPVARVLWRHGLGGILADDMGLGKTLQTLALLCARHEGREPRTSVPFLIVAPTSVLANWAAEARRFTPDLKVVTIGDTLARRGVALESVIAGADAVVTSYTLLRLDFESYGALPWAGLVLDEAQYVKNHHSKAHACARKVAAPFKVAITGTPMENNLMELWSLLSITAPGLFPNPERFKRALRAPDREGRRTRSCSASCAAGSGRSIMRRTKEQVAADLPEKQEQILEVELSPRHRRLYQTHLQRERQKVLGLLGDVNRNRFTILRSLTLLRQLACMPPWWTTRTATSRPRRSTRCSSSSSDVVGGGHRALVFSQFTRFLRMVREPPRGGRACRTAISTAAR